MNEKCYIYSFAVLLKGISMGGQLCKNNLVEAKICLGNIEKGILI